MASASSSTTVLSFTPRVGDFIPALLGARQRGNVSSQAFEARIYHNFLVGVRVRVGEKEYRALIDRVTFGTADLSETTLAKRLWMKEYTQLKWLNGFLQSEKWHAVADPFLAKGPPELMGVNQYLQMKKCLEIPFARLPKSYSEELEGDLPGDATAQFHLIMSLHSLIRSVVCKIV